MMRRVFSAAVQKQQRCLFVRRPAAAAVATASAAAAGLNTTDSSSKRHFMSPTPVRRDKTGGVPFVHGVQENAIIGAVHQHMIAKGAFSDTLINKMVDVYFKQFGGTYMHNFKALHISEHVHGFTIARMAEEMNGRFKYSFKSDTHAFFFCKETIHDIIKTEHEIEMFLKESAHLLERNSCSIRSYHSANDKTVIYTASFHPFINPHPEVGPDTKIVLEQLASDNFLRVRSAKSHERYRQVLQQLETSITPVHIITPETDFAGKALALTIAVKPDIPLFFSSITAQLSQIPNAVIAKKFMETFSNGAQVYTVYISGADASAIEHSALNLPLIPQHAHNPIYQMHQRGALSAEETLYSFSVVNFAFYFSKHSDRPGMGELFRSLAHNPGALKILKDMQKESHQDVMSETLICDIIARNIQLTRELFEDFRQGQTTPEREKELRAKIHLLEEPIDRELFRTVIKFNKAVVKTNFFCAKKAALAYRLDPSFIADLDFPRVPHGIFMVMGAEFRGFHVRFTDIARGGIRLIKPTNPNAYKARKQKLFHENYNLSYAQMLKNKDIPEGGSKGTIQVSTRQRDLSDRAYERIFLKYVDAMLDVIVPNTDGVRDFLKQEEILFFGPDENTAGHYPSLAAKYAKGRGYKTWKSFTTGKAQSDGGIPHDLYGMTSLSVRMNVNSVYEMLKLDGTKLTKFMTGGPDGDLGCNEIKLGVENTNGIVDGSGVLYDPAGLDKAELLRLADKRIMVENFDRSKLSKDGFLVLTTDAQYKLPDGDVIESGLSFRNGFHLTKYAEADTFCPCGGTPGSITLSNVHHLVKQPGVTGRIMMEGSLGNLAAQGKTKFKYIVEGANLFITHDARMALEKVGVVLIKDSTANKGGVSCSSLEVLSGLAMTDEEHAKYMCAQNGETSEFYKAYVDEIMGRVQKAARREFECIWREAQKGSCGGSYTMISDELSQKIVNIRRFIYLSSLFEDTELVRYILHNYTPATMLEKIPLDKFMERVPTNYQRAIFAISIASDFVYTTGLDANEFTFFEYMNGVQKKAAAWKP